MWCDQAKSVWSRSNSLFSFLTTCLHHFYNYILQKTPLKLVSWFQRYEQLKDAKHNRKQKTFSSLFGSILKSIFPISDWFCLITSQILVKYWQKLILMSVFCQFPSLSSSICWQIQYNTKKLKVRIFWKSYVRFPSNKNYNDQYT